MSETKGRVGPIMTEIRGELQKHPPLDVCPHVTQAMRESPLPRADNGGACLGTTE